MGLKFKIWGTMISSFSAPPPYLIEFIAISMIGICLQTDVACDYTEFILRLIN